MSLTDLHLCESSTEDDASQKYWNIPGECSYSISTLISWQHFPRSTSSRSRCDDSLSPVPFSFSTSFLTQIQEGEKELSVKVPSFEHRDARSKAQLVALNYLEVRHVFEFFNFLIGHLVCNEPENPIAFLDDLLQKCLRFRDNYGEPPLLFTHNHIKSLYRAFDVFERGYITKSQYHEAMKTLGITNGIVPYNQTPPLTKDGNVEESFFLFEAEKCVAENLKQMLRIPTKYSIRKSPMKKRTWKKNKAPEKIPSPILAQYTELEGEYGACKCCTKAGSAMECKCEVYAQTNEPEQLFYNNTARKNPLNHS